MVEIRNTTTEIKNAFHKVINKADTAEERIKYKAWHK